MKQKYLLSTLLVVMCSLVACSETNNSNSTTPTATSNKGVKEMTITQIAPNMAFGGLHLGDTLSVSVSSFSEDGRTLSNYVYDEDGLSDSEIYKWDNHTCIVEGGHYYYSTMRGEITLFSTSRREEEYDNEYRLLHRKEYHNDELRSEE